MHSCTDCGWSIRTDEDRSRDECNARAIRHYCETEHTVVRRSADRQSGFRSVLGEDRL